MRLTMNNESKNTEKNEMYTGKEFISSLEDDRQVYINGQRLKNITIHPAFYNSIKSISSLYDALHNPCSREIMTTLDPLGYRTHRYFTPSHSAEELLAARNAISYWAKLSYGFMGRTPDYKAGFTATLYTNPEIYQPFEKNALRWYEHTSRKVLYLNHVLVNPPVGRSRPVSEMKDIFLHAEKEVDGGIIVRGAKMVATSAAISNATFVAQNSATQYSQGKDEDFALCFILPMNAPNLKILCRKSYEQSAVTPFDNPLSSRFDENDAVLVFDGVFVPWENILIYRDTEKARSFYSASGFLHRYPLQSTTRLAVKLDFLCGLLIKALKSNGTYEFRGIKTKLAEVISWRNLLWSLTESMCHAPQSHGKGSVIPRLDVSATARVWATQVMAYIKPIFNTILGGSSIMQVVGSADIQCQALANDIDLYFQGTDSDALTRTKLFKVLWDAIGSEFAGRNELYEYNYAGNNEQVRIDMLNHCDSKGILDYCTSFVEQCMDDYDLNGWINPVWK